MNGYSPAVDRTDRRLRRLRRSGATTDGRRRAPELSDSIVRNAGETLETAGVIP